MFKVKNSRNTKYVILPPALFYPLDIQQDSIAGLYQAARNSLYYRHLQLFATAE